MAKRPFLGFITVVVGIPFLAFLIYFVSRYEPPLLHWFVWENALIVVSSLIGGLLLWQGNVWGYRLSAFAWLLVVFASLSSLVALFQSSGSSDVTDALAKLWMGKDLVLLVIGALATYPIVRDLLQTKK
jgi:hypothetical protein